MTRPPKTDIHLSAYRISPATIQKLEKSGFCRDDFANNTRCDVTAYHATFRGEIHPSADHLWEETRSILEADPLFEGGLEEEAYAPDETVYFNGQEVVPAPLPAPSLPMAQPPPGKHKACDIHININLNRTSDAALAFINSLEFASFDRPCGASVHRVFSATCETTDAGRALFNYLSSYLAHIPGLVGKAKIETISRFLRLPENAPVLPMASEDAVLAWLRARATEE